MLPGPGALGKVPELGAGADLGGRRLQVRLRAEGTGRANASAEEVPEERTDPQVKLPQPLKRRDPAQVDGSLIALPARPISCFLLHNRGPFPAVTQESLWLSTGRAQTDT